MKRICLCCLCFFVFLFSQETENDSSLTRVPLSEVKHYEVMYGENAGTDNGMLDEYSTIASEKPFSFRQPGDRWFSHDKWMHLSSAYFLTLQNSYLLDKMLLVSPETSRHISIGITVSFSIGKELYDVIGKNGIFSWKDLFYDVLGATLGYLTATVIQQ